MRSVEADNLTFSLNKIQLNESLTVCMAHLSMKWNWNRSTSPERNLTLTQIDLMQIVRVALLEKLVTFVSKTFLKKVYKDKSITEFNTERYPYM